MSKKFRPEIKKAQLIQMLNRSSGVRIGAIETKLGWQPHTIRAEISRLRKRGCLVTCASSPKGPVYRAHAPEQE